MLRTRNVEAAEGGTPAQGSLVAGSGSYGWVIYNSSNQIEQSGGAADACRMPVELTPCLTGTTQSSTRQEANALLSLHVAMARIASSSDDCYVSNGIDSESAMNRYNSLPYMHDQDLLKIPNHDVWLAIKIMQNTWVRRSG